jgi:hypothetical protein
MNHQSDNLNDTRLFLQFINTDKNAFKGKKYQPSKSYGLKSKRILKK